MSFIKKVKTYIINLKERADRRLHILQEFKNKEGFDIELVQAIKNKNGAVGLLNSYQKCVKDALVNAHKFIIICEDDHFFTKAYTYKKLITCIEMGIDKDFDILLGGVSGFENAIKMNNDIVCLENFSGTQFTIIYERFYRKFLDIKIGHQENIDIKMRHYTDRIFCIYPQISSQKMFGYSDVTQKNNNANVESYFELSQIRMDKLYYLSDFYENILKIWRNIDFEFKIPAYLLLSDIGENESKYLEADFKKRTEFQVSTVNYKHSGNIELNKLKAFQNIVRIAEQNSEDFIVISTTKHKFTEAYRSVHLMNVIVKAHHCHCKILVGNEIKGSSNILIIDKDLYWFDNLECVSFYVLFNSVYQHIKDLKVLNGETIESTLSSISSNKLAIYPPISGDVNKGKDVDAIDLVGKRNIEKLYLKRTNLKNLDSRL